MIEEAGEVGEGGGGVGDGRVCGRRGGGPTSSNKFNMSSRSFKIKIKYQQSNSFHIKDQRCK